MKIKKILFILTLFLVLPFTKVNAEAVNVNVFYGEGCPYCAEEEKYLNILKSELGDNLNIQRYEVWNNDENSKLLSDVRMALNDNGDGVPFVVIGNKTFTGYNDSVAEDIKTAIFDNLKNPNVNIVELIKNGQPVPTDTSLNTDPTIHFTILGDTNVKETSAATIAVTEGMSDAINLGSLWIMLFLAGIMLCVYNKKKRWILGGIFVLTSTVTYAILCFTNAEFTINQTTFIRSFVSIVAIIIAAISIDAHMKINIPKKSILQSLQETFNKKQMFVYAISIIITSVIATFTLVNQAHSSPTLVKTALEIQNITGGTYAMYMILYFLMYLLVSIILFAVVNTIIKELIIENTIGTYNRLIAGIVMLVAAAILLFVPSIFMMIWPKQGLLLLQNNEYSLQFHLIMI